MSKKKKDERASPPMHRHRWRETTGVDTGCGAEWFYDCHCGATRYVCEDQGHRTEEITDGE